MRIAQVVSSYHPGIGGVETHVRRLAEGCTDAGDCVTVITHRVGCPSVDEWIGGVRVLRFPLTISSQKYPFSRSLSRFLQLHANDFDLVHAHNYHTLVGHAAISSRLPFVFTPHYHGTGHTSVAAFAHKLYRPFGARQFKAADTVICVSDAERDAVIKDFPSISGKVLTIPNGVDQKQPTFHGDQSTSDQPIVLTIGRLERYKNVDLVIDAFRALPSPATLVVVGDGPERIRLEQRAQASESGWPILFTGRISDPMLKYWFARAHVVTSASDHEAFGLALAEGLASGTRVVASAIPAHVALGRLAGASTPVTLVDPRDTRKFTDLLAESLMAGRIQGRSFTLPSWTQIVGTTRELYSRILLRALLTGTHEGIPDMPQPFITPY